MTDYKKLPFRLGVGIMLINEDNQVFVGKRIDTKSEAWQMPQGGIDKGEDADQAALRELEEETGITEVNVIASSKDWLSYDLPYHLVPSIWGGKYRGQKQKWYLMRFTGEDNMIDLNRHKPEFLKYKWVFPSQLPNIIVPFKQDLYRKIVKEFEDKI